MSKLFAFIVVVSSLIFFTGCKKDTPQSPVNTGAIAISNLVYNPTTVTIKDDAATFNITGTFSFKNVSKGVSAMRITTSAGADVTITVPPNNATEGRLTGVIEVETPPAPGEYTFTIWIIDMDGNISNKLSGTIQVTIDDSGTSWRFTGIPGAFPHYKVIRADSKFIAVGTGIISSQDGAHWSLVYNPSSTGIIPPLHGIAKSPSQYVAVGENKSVVTSSDGTNWVVTSSGTVIDYTLYSVVWTGTQFVAVGWDVSNNKTQIVSSADGIDWTENIYFVAGGVLNAIAKSNSLIVAVGKEYFNGSYRPLVITSTNGTDWTKQSITSAGSSLNDVIWTGDKFLAVGTGLTAVSTDGISWANHDDPSLTLYGAVHSGHTYVAVGTAIYTSTNAVTWTHQMDYNGLGNPFRSIAWSGHGYVVVGYPYNALLSP